MKKECIFCKIFKKEIPAKIIYENKNFFSIKDANPKTKGHSLVISKKHFENFKELPSELGPELIDCIKKTSEIIIKENNAQGFNIINNNSKEAGQIINHIHFHVIPRKKGDNIQGIF